LLISWYAGGKCDMVCSDEDRGRSWRLGAEDRGWSHRSVTRWPTNREVGWRRVRSAPCTWRRGARVSWLSQKNQGRWVVSGLVSKSLGWFLQFGLKIGDDSFLVEPQNQGGEGFPGLGLKIGNYDLMIWASKSLRWFLGLGLKTKHASVCRLCHKIDRGRSARDTHRDLAACFTWKQTWLGFSNLASRLEEARRREVHVAPSQRLHQSQVEDRRVDMTGCIRPFYPTFAVFSVLGARGIVVI
jgi:hypothetical protein